MQLDLGKGAIDLGRRTWNVILPHEPKALKPIYLHEMVYCVEYGGRDSGRVTIHHPKGKVHRQGSQEGILSAFPSGFIVSTPISDHAKSQECISALLRQN